MGLTPDRPDGVRLRRLSTAELTPAEIDAIRAMLVAAFGDDEDERFTDDDWEHAVGGVHVVLDVDGEIVTHASVVERELRVDGRPLRTGYVEAVATAPAWQGRGYGTTVMRDVIAATSATGSSSARSGRAATGSTNGSAGGRGPVRPASGCPDGDRADPRR